MLDSDLIDLNMEAKLWAQVSLVKPCNMASTPGLRGPAFEHSNRYPDITQAFISILFS